MFVIRALWLPHHADPMATIWRVEQPMRDSSAFAGEDRVIPPAKIVNAAKSLVPLQVMANLLPRDGFEALGTHVSYSSFRGQRPNLANRCHSWRDDCPSITLPYLGRMNSRAAKLACIGIAFGSRLLVQPAGSQGTSPVAAIAGRVVDSLGNAIPLATVTLGHVGGDVAQTALTDASGRYRFLSVTGQELVLSARRLGFVPSSIFLGSIARADTLRRDIQLRVVATPLATVVARSARTTVAPLIRGRSPGETGESYEPLTLRYYPVDPGDLSAIALLTPGVAITGRSEDGTPKLSIAGQDPSQNRTTLDGASYSGASIPAEALATVLVTTHVYDVARGQFGGGEISATTRSGTNVWGGAFSTSLDAPALQTGSPRISGASPRYSLAQVNAGGGGRIVPDRLFIFGAFRFSRRGADIPFLENQSTTDLRLLGVQRDSVQRFFDAVRGLGIANATQPHLAIMTAASALTRVDYLIGERHLMTLRLDGRFSDFGNLGSTPLDLPGSGSALAIRDGGSLAQLSSRFGRVEHESRISWSRGSWSSESSDQSPAGRVLVTSDFEDGTQDISALQFGGSILPFGRAERQQLELADEVRIRLGSGSHRIKIGGLLNDERAATNGASDERGTFTFASLADFQSGQPSEFTRTFGTSKESDAKYGAAFIGDTYRLGRLLSITYGLRAERSLYRAGSGSEMVTDSLFGSGMREVPTETRLLPRIGFTYTNANSHVTLHGGAGVFRGKLPVQSLANARGSADELRLTCVGTAAPRPDWALYRTDPNAIPATCVDDASVFAARAPDLSLFAPDFGAPRNRRASLDFSGQLVDKYFLSATATIVQGTGLPVATDRNLGAVRFTLPNEGGRPVFVVPAAVDPASGSASSSASRIFPEFGVARYLSGQGRSSTAQLSVGANAVTPWMGVAGIWYTFSRSSDVSSGLDAIVGPAATTGADPRTPERAATDFDAHHTLEAMLSQNLNQRVDLSLIARTSSGAPFTPVVSGDVNADTRYNDRAFVFDPLHTADSAVARDMARLLASGTKSVQNCLIAQLGRVAARNSCRGPWSSSLDLQANVRFGGQGLASRFVLTIIAENLLAGADYALSGSNRLRGWGQQPFPDATLLRVRGFDPAVPAYRYDVNPAFGSTSGVRTGYAAPFAIKLQGRLVLGADPAVQPLANIVATARSSGLSAEDIKRTLTTRFVNVPARVLAMKGSVDPALTVDQAEKLARAADSIAPRLDSTVVSLAALLSALESPRASQVDKLVGDAEALVAAGRASARTILSSKQWRSLPRELREQVRNDPLTPAQSITIPAGDP
jgi:hypothetical protein